MRKKSIFKTYIAQIMFQIIYYFDCFKSFKGLITIYKLSFC